MTFHSRTLGVPARRDVGAPEVLRGKRVFHETGCTACHAPKFVTHRLEGPADRRPSGRATGREWRTAPLRGIGLTEQVSGVARYLHDGRARSLLEAVLWHGGEAAAQREAVIAMDPADRAALVRFLESL